MAISSISLEDAKSMIGREVTFSTINIYDNRVVVGVVEAVATAVAAKTITDVVNYNEQVIKGYPTDQTHPDYYAGTDVDILMYVLIRSGTANGAMEAYAIDWISHWEITDESKGNVNISLINVNAQNVADALAALSVIGISSKVI